MLYFELLENLFIGFLLKCFVYHRELLCCTVLFKSIKVVAIRIVCVPYQVGCLVKSNFIRVYVTNCSEVKDERSFYFYKNCQEDEHRESLPVPL